MTLGELDSRAVQRADSAVLELPLPDQIIQVAAKAIAEFLSQVIKMLEFIYVRRMPSQSCIEP